MMAATFHPEPPFALRAAMGRAAGDGETGVCVTIGGGTGGGDAEGEFG